MTVWSLLVYSSDGCIGRWSLLRVVANVMIRHAMPVPLYRYQIRSLGLRPSVLAVAYSAAHSGPHLQPTHRSNAVRTEGMPFHEFDNTWPHTRGPMPASTHPPFATGQLSHETLRTFGHLFKSSAECLRPMHAGVSPRQLRQRLRPLNWLMQMCASSAMCHEVGYVLPQG